MVAQERITHDLLGIVQAYAPTSVAQAQCAEILNMAALDGASDQAQQLLLARILVDGLTWGNWPWTPPKVPSESYPINPPPHQADSDGNYCDPLRQTSRLFDSAPNT